MTGSAKDELLRLRAEVAAIMRQKKQDREEAKRRDERLQLAFALIKRLEDVRRLAEMILRWPASDDCKRDLTEAIKVSREPIVLEPGSDKKCKRCGGYPIRLPEESYMLKRGRELFGPDWEPRLCKACEINWLIDSSSEERAAGPDSMLWAME